MLTTTLVLTLPESSNDYVVYCDASRVVLGFALKQQRKVITYASRYLKAHEKYYATHDLKLIDTVLLVCCSC